MNQFHRIYKGEEDYEKKMEYLQYDMLDGKKYIYDKTEPYSRIKMKIGLKDIVIEDARILGNTVEVTGVNFNEYSCIYVDGKPITTKYVSENKLIGELSNSKGSKVKVHQLTKRNKSLGATKEFIISK